MASGERFITLGVDAGRKCRPCLYPGIGVGLVDMPGSLEALPGLCAAIVHVRQSPLEQPVRFMIFEKAIGIEGPRGSQCPFSFHGNLRIAWISVPYDVRLLLKKRH
jgi:hypothetical protein